MVDIQIVNVLPAEIYENNAREYFITGTISEPRQGRAIFTISIKLDVMNGKVITIPATTVNLHHVEGVFLEANSITEQINEIFLDYAKKNLFL